MSILYLDKGWIIYCKQGRNSRQGFKNHGKKVTCRLEVNENLSRGLNTSLSFDIQAIARIKILLKTKTRKLLWQMKPMESHI